MTQLHINIKDSDRAILIINLLKELPFVEFLEIDGSKINKSVKPARKGKKSLEDLFGLWENREISLTDIRKKAWSRGNDTL